MESLLAAPPLRAAAIWRTFWRWLLCLDLDVGLEAAR